MYYRSADPPTGRSNLLSIQPKKIIAMSAFKNIMVGLDLTPMDEPLLRYVAFLVRTFDIAEICFVHNVKPYDLPDDWEDILPDDFSSLEELIEQDIREKARGYLGDRAYDVVVTRSDYTAHAIASLANERWVDTLLLGKKVEYQGKGIQAHKMLQLAKCHLLFVTESSLPKLDRILVPIDFSRHSRLSIEYAARLSRRTQAPYRSLHVFQLPQRYFPYIQKDQVAIDKMRDHAQRAYDKFRKTLPHDIAQGLACDFEPAHGRSITQAVIQHGRQLKADLVIIGVKGRNPIPTLIVGGVTTRMIASEMKMPLLILRG